MAKRYYHYFSGITDNDGNNFSIRSLEEGQVSFSHISAFNDPCELAILPDGSDYIAKHIDEIKFIYELQFRVFCFSKTCTNPIMWGHYGNAHRGFCVGYDEEDIINIDWPKQRFIFDKVSYSESVPRLSEYEVRNGRALYYKSIDWKNENEWRASLYLELTSDGIIDENEFGKARQEWIEKNEYFEKAVDSWKSLSFFDLPLPITTSEAEKKVHAIREEAKSFELNNYVYSIFISDETREIVYGKLPLRVNRVLKPKAIYIGLKTCDELRRKLKQVAKEQNIEIYEITIREGQYEFVPRKVII